jgi:hypothetical protein
MFYPIGKCDTYKAVTMDHIILKNITSTNSLLPAGVILCNDTNPCTNFHFEDVDLRTPVWDALGYGWISQYVEGEAIRTFPDPKFKPNGYYASLKEEDKVDEAAEIQKLLTAESMMSHLIDTVFSLKYGRKFANEQNRLKEIGVKSEILDII